MKTLFKSRIVRYLAFLSLLAGVAMVPLFGAHDTGLFELDTRAGVEGDQDKKNDPIPAVVGDGNTIDEAAPGDDWENIYCDVVPNPLCAIGPVGPSGAFASSWVEDTFANNNIDNGAEPFVALRTPENTFFTGGGSKDTNGIQDGPWKYKIVSDQVPDKNDIVNAFAAAYDDPSDGHTIFYFGLDTFSVNGDSNAGFWFFRKPVSLGPLDGDTGTFIGEHTTGDIFVAVAYTQGGRVGDIDVYEWVGDDTTGSLVLQFSGQDCADAAANDDVCGVINKLLPDETFGEDPIFDYANTLVANNPLDPTSYQYESAAFVEFGLDVEAILSGPIGCFTTFLAETRSSQSETAQLKDFAFGAFPFCSIAVEKTGDTLSKVGDDVDYTITVTNDGRATLHKQSIIDSVFGDLTDGTNPLITASDCGATLAPSASCTITVTRTVMMGDPDPLENTVTVVYTEFADPASLSFTDSDDHSVNLFQPLIAVDKTGDTLSKVGDDVNYTITLSNNSSDDTPELTCTATDTLLGEVFSDVLPAGDTVLTPSRTVEEGDPDPLDNTVTLNCSIDGFSNVLEESDGHSTNLFQPAIAVDKTGDDLSKVGDDVDYTITLSNNSSADTPALTCVATDTLLGELFNGTLPLGDTVINNSRTVQMGDPDPLENTVTLNCSIDGFPNVLEESEGHSTNLFQPGVEIIKTADCDVPIQIGETITYSFTINNLSSGDAPDLILDSVTDTVLGDLTATAAAAGCGTLGASCNFDVLYDTSGEAPGLLVNVVTAHYHPDGFPNDITDDDDHTCDIVLPAPAMVVIEKLLIGSEGLVFSYTTSNLPTDPGFTLTPLFANVPLANSPFPAPIAGQSFDTTIALTVGFASVSDTEVVTVSEDMPLPGLATFNNLMCLAATDGFLTNPAVIGGAMATLSLRSGDSAFCRFVNEIPSEGCTPGYWRNHLDQWAATGFAPGDDFDTTFGVDLFNPDITLEVAINLGGGGVNKLARHGTAALLSAAHPGVNYPFSVADVIALVQAGNVDPLVAANELGCPID